MPIAWPGSFSTFVGIEFICNDSYFQGFTPSKFKFIAIKLKVGRLLSVNVHICTTPDKTEHLIIKAFSLDC
jgi:hypothetical protein